LSVDQVVSVAQMRERAARALPKFLFDYVDGGAEDEITMRANRAAFEDVTLDQRVPSTTDAPDLRTTVLGTPLSLPVILAPCGLAAAMHVDGPTGVAHAGAALGTISVLSAVAGVPMERVAPVEGPKWFQLYSTTGREGAAPLIERAQACGFQALVVTTDTATLGMRERDARLGITMPIKATPALGARIAVQVAARPGWLKSFAAAAIAARRNGTGPIIELPNMAASPFTFADIGWMRERWSGPLVVKGLMSADDARAARDAGADAVVVSNHGGRQLEGAPATLAVLPSVVEAVGDDIPVIVDGGVRRGRDVVAACALGAAAVMIGRPYLYGLAVGGRAGVERILDILRSEMARTMILMDRRSIASIDRDAVR
jgi:L-lactate dehydrogenase (cytochrome)